MHDSSSNSSELGEKKRRRKDKKEKKRKRSYSDDYSSEEEGRARRKEKKRKKKKKKKVKNSGAIDQDRYGKYGIIRECDFHSKSASFDAWLRDIKKISEFNGPRREAMEYFKEYMEDFNTATLPHEKYYDIEKYEKRKYHKKEAERERKQQSSTGNDDFQLTLQLMNKEKIQAMRKQEELRSQMQALYRSGDTQRAREIEALLNSRS